MTGIEHVDWVIWTLPTAFLAIFVLVNAGIQQHKTALFSLVFRYSFFGFFYFGAFFMGLAFDYISIASSSIELLDALNFSFTLTFWFTPTKEIFQRHERYLIRNMREGVSNGKILALTMRSFAPPAILSMVCWSLLRPQLGIWEPYQAGEDYFSFKEKVTMARGLGMISIAVLAFSSIVFARIQGRRMQTLSLLGEVDQSLDQAEAQYGAEGRRLWLQWWTDQVRETSAQLQCKLYVGRYDGVKPWWDGVIKAPEPEQCTICVNGRAWMPHIHTQDRDHFRDGHTWTQDDARVSREIRLT